MTRISGDFEELVILAILKLDNDTYSVPLRELLEEATGRMVSIGALFVTLDRLVQKGYLETRNSEPTGEQGGRAKRFFSVTGTGQEALKELHKPRRALGGFNLGRVGGGA